MSFKGIIFDLDGTLVNTLYDIGFHINNILARYSYPAFPMDKVNTIVGWGLKEALRKVIPPEDSADETYLCRLTAELIGEYNREPVLKSVLYPGIHELLDELATRGILLSVFSNKSQPVTLQVVDRLMGLKRFSTVLGSDAGFPRKPDPAGALEVIRRMGLEKEDILYIGDTILDHQVAVGAGIADITVTWGFRSREQLSEQGASNFVDVPAEILRYFN
ncbi:MAG: HAD family hydrolase [Spirochaetia bacterium]|nr:HAD family hydrolase [Spirochaetia bacterium]